MWSDHMQVLCRAGSMSVAETSIFVVNARNPRPVGPDLRQSGAMTDYSDPQRSSERLSDAERETAVQQLATARGEGRLRPDEFEQRATSARAAVTRGELATLFSDLPAPSTAQPAPPAGSFATTAPFMGGPSSPGAYDDQARSGAYDDSRDIGDPGGSGSTGVHALGGRWGTTIMALTPFIALVLFFVTSYAVGWAWSWLWFLLIPVVGIIVYGPGSDGRGRDRDRRRDRR